MKTLNELKDVKICKCSVEELEQLKNDVLSLNKDEIKEFLLNILDEQYILNYSPKTCEDLDYDEKKLEKFLSTEEFKPFHREFVNELKENQKNYEI